jgi:membrane protein implicated in regulation of membrane protease activity
MNVLANFWIWWILAAVLMGLEIFAPGAFMIWIGFGAALTGVFAWIFPGIGIELQLLFFAIFSVILAVIGRKTVMVTKAIKNGKGKVRVGDTEWLAAGPNAKEGESVKVVGAQGTTLEVEKK